MLPRRQPVSILLFLGVVLMSAGLESESPQRPIHASEYTSGSVDQIDRIDTALLYQIIRPITTITDYEDGKVERNTGNGFIAGHMFFTVSHNLRSTFQTKQIRKSSFVDGVPVTPSYDSADQDLAVFELPPELCAEHCNSISLNTDMPVKTGQRVFWLRKFDGTVAHKEARVVDYAWIGPAENPEANVGTCDGRLIVQIDAPFLPGSSGSPVVNDTGEIVGIIQGSLISGEEETGFFKPLSCLARPEVSRDLRQALAKRDDPGQ